MLARKQSIKDNRDWLEALDRCTEVCSRWMAEKWKRQNQDIARHGFDLFIAGRRLKDGNQCGKADDDFTVQKKGYVTFSPLADWSHEELLAYIRYNGIELPPFYNFPRGFMIGSIAMGEWTEYACLDKTVAQVWDEIYMIEPSLVIEASKHLTSAKTYLDKTTEG